MPPPRLAALPMYDFPHLREAHDAFWEALASRLRSAGLEGVPGQLSREGSHLDVWQDRGLLFAQGCEYPLAKSFADRIRIIATPMYSAPGCEGAQYRSAVIVSAERAGDSVRSLRGLRCAVNEASSNSGMNLLRAAVAPFAEAGRFFASSVLSGSHLCSLEMVASGAADVAAIDCVTLAHLQQATPAACKRVRVLGWTPSSPCLPWITSQSTSDDDLSRIRIALGEVLADPQLSITRSELLLQGADLQPRGDFADVLRLEQDAAAAGYPAIDGLYR